MTDATLLLVGRAGSNTSQVLGTHAERLERRTDLPVEPLVYRTDPYELAETVADLDAGTVYALPATFAHTHETTGAVPEVLDRAPGEVHYCEPIGTSPAVTSLIDERASAECDPGEDASLVLAGLGNSSLPFGRQTVEYHAARIRDRGGFDEVVTCYLLQNPTVECARYNVSNDRAVAVPLFFARSEATDSEVPDKLGVDRGGLAYAEPLGTHPLVTDAIHGRLARRRTLVETGAADGTFEASLSAEARPVAADGRGPDPDAGEPR